ncbi:MAG: NAD(+) diphosphatase [Proteobacteria bacterium]|nr:NAD(+) diphosphatase [Pseudomonadota bacterium]
MHFENQQQALQMLKEYGRSEALFFTDDSILIEEKTKQPFMTISAVVETLQMTIHAAHKHDDIIAIHGIVSEKASDYEIVPVKTFLSTTNNIIQSSVLKAYHWLNWDMNSRYCGRCSTRLQATFDSVEKKCSNCSLSIFPKVSPAVMVLIYRDKEILLARSAHFRPGMYSAVAGFIELGETAEMAAVREVKEELGIQIKDISYFGTQTWPFPDSFMIAFKAKYDSGELQIDKNEIEDARWFNKADLPVLPPSASISRSLIESVISTW